jgi:hypothetical protein
MGPCFVSVCDDCILRVRVRFGNRAGGGSARATDRLSHAHNAKRTTADVTRR